MKLVNVYMLRKEIAEYGAQLAGCYSAGIARYMNKMLDYIIAEVDRAPSVNAVIVVRCKDCKYRDPEDKKCDCGHAILWQLTRDDDWFCADGERRDDETD